MLLSGRKSLERYRISQIAILVIYLDIKLASFCNDLNFSVLIKVQEIEGALLLHYKPPVRSTQAYARASVMRVGNDSLSRTNSKSI